MAQIFFSTIKEIVTRTATDTCSHYIVTQNYSVLFRFFREFFKIIKGFLFPGLAPEGTIFLRKNSTEFAVITRVICGNNAGNWREFHCI